MSDGISIDIKGFAEWRSSVSTYKRESERAIKAGMKRFMLMLQQEVKRRILEQDLYDTGNLHDSIEVKIVSVSDQDWEGKVYTSVEYAVVYEFGGIVHNGSGFYLVPARPFMSPAVSATQYLAELFVIDEMKKRGLVTGDSPSISEGLLTGMFRGRV